MLLITEAQRLMDEEIARIRKEAGQEPFGWFHELLYEDGNGKGVYLGITGPDAEKVIHQSHEPGETSTEKIQLYR